MAARKPLSLYVFVVVLVRRGFRYLMVQEAQRSERGLWYVPAGAVRPGEDLIAACHREILATAGIQTEITGLVSIEHMPVLPGWDFARWRFVLEARVKPGSPEPRSEPSDDALRAQFLMPSEIEELPLRSDDALNLIRKHARGQPVAPIDAIYQIGIC